MIAFLLICSLAGAAGAILQGMLGIGTGIVVVPLLTFILPQYGVDQTQAIHIALATSMAAIACNSVTALISHHSRGNIKWSMFKMMLAFSLCGSTLGAVVASMTSARYLQAIFGSFLLLTAAYMLLKKHPHDLVDAEPTLSLPKLATGGFSIGFIASIIGSGGGVLMVPFLHSLKLKMRYAVGTSTLIGFPVAVVGAMTYVFMGLSELPSTNTTIGYLHWPAFLAITSAGMLCTPIGVKLASVIHTRVLQIFFAILIVIIGLRMLNHL